MNAIPSDLTLTQSVAGSAPPDDKLPLHATIYFFAIATVACIVSVPLLIRLSSETPNWIAFFVLGTCAAVAQLFVVRTPRSQAYHTTIVFLIPAAMVLPPELVALMGLVQPVPEWLKNRIAWYSQTFI